MKPFPSFALAVSLVSLTTNLLAAELDLERAPERKWRVGVSLSIGLDASANFSRLSPVLLPPPPPDVNLIDRRYDDGLVLRDSYADGMNTIYWGYFNNSANQNINPGGDRLTLHKTSVAQPASAPGADSDPYPGVELTLSRDLGELGRGRWGLEGGFGFFNLNIKDNRSITVNGTLTSDQYNLADSAAGFFGGSFPNNYQGVFGPAFNVPFIPDTPITGTRTTTPVALSVTGNREFDASVYFWRLGAYWEMPLMTNLTLIANGGMVLAWIHSDFSFNQTTVLPYGAPLVESGAGSRTGWQMGGYVGLNLRYALSDRWSVLAGGRYEKVGDYHQTAGGKQAELQFGKSVFLTVGVAYSF